jgi:hypothetical protein
VNRRFEVVAMSYGPESLEIPKTERSEPFTPLRTATGRPRPPTLHSPMSTTVDTRRGDCKRHRNLSGGATDRFARSLRTRRKPRLLSACRVSRCAPIAAWLENDCRVVYHLLLTCQVKVPTCRVQGHDDEPGMQIQVVSAAAGDALTNCAARNPRGQSARATPLVNNPRCSI